MVERQKEEIRFVVMHANQSIRIKQPFTHYNKQYIAIEIEIKKQN